MKKIRYRFRPKVILASNSHRVQAEMYANTRQYKWGKNLSYDEQQFLKDNKNFWLAKYSIPCGFGNHLIVFTKYGAISLHNHPNSKENLRAVMFDIAKNKEISKTQLSPCLSLLRAFIQGASSFHRENYTSWHGNPFHRVVGDMPFIEHLKKIREERQKYKTAFCKQKSEREIYVQEAEDKLTEELERDLIYRQSVNGHRIVLKINPVPNTISNIDGKIKAENPKAYRMVDREIHSEVKVEVPITWLLKVHKNKKHIIDGHFVIDIHKEYPNGKVLATVGKQGYGTKIYPCFAILDYDKQHIRWLDTDEAEKFLTTKKIPRNRKFKEPDAEGVSLVGELQEAVKNETD